MRQLGPPSASRFNDFGGTIEIDEDLLRSSARASIQAASIDTRHADRDAHLRSGDFLDAERHPTLAFRSAGLRREGERWLLDGEFEVLSVEAIKQ
jgi:polyisoprenoid-binding protein YceI